MVATLQVDFGGGVIDNSTPMSDITWTAADTSINDLSTMQVDMVVVSTNGTTAAIERTRTTLERVFPNTIGLAPETVSEFKSRSPREINRYRQLANVVLLTSLPIAGCSLAVSIAGGLAERRRPFSLLRLTGVPLATLRRIVSLEAAVPLLISIVVSAAAGLVAAALFLHAQLEQTLQAPSLGYYELMVAGVVASFAIIASTMPLLARLTGPESARND
jgi:predicted lysophospholipase L1 biosynthesis ABC-type transport system permease subunit